MINKKKPEVYKTPVTTINSFKPQVRKQIDLELIFEEDKENTKGKFLIIDVETTGLPKDRNAKPEDTSNWPRVVQIAWLIFNDDQKLIERHSYILKPKAKIPQKSISIHGITNEMAKEKGVEQKFVYDLLSNSIRNSEYIIAHNIEFDIPIIQSDFIRNKLDKPFLRKKKICTMLSTIDYCAIPRNYGNGFKYPNLTELARKCFCKDNEILNIIGAHDAEVDTMVTAKCFFYLLNNNIILLDKPNNEKSEAKKIDSQINIIEKINLTSEILTEQQIEVRFSSAYKLLKQSTEAFNYDQEKSINYIIEAINSFPFLVPDFIYKLSYYLQRANLYNQAYQVLDMAIAKLDIDNISLYNLHKCNHIEKYAIIKYSEHVFIDYIHYFFKWYHNRLLVPTFQGKKDELTKLLNLDDKYSLWTPTKMTNSFKNLGLETLSPFFNGKLIDYSVTISETLQTCCESIIEINNKLGTSYVFSQDRINSEIKLNDKLYLTYKSLNDSFDDNYYKENIEKILK